MLFTTLVSMAAAALSLPAALAQDKLVVAHFIAGNAADMSPSDWAADIVAAQQAQIDGFAMNIAAGDANTDKVLAAAYQAAETAGNFSMFLSFDYLSEGAWDAGSVTNLINQYKTSSAQLYYKGGPLVSTFEGVDNIGDWSGIKSATGAYFIPSWTSLGPSGVASNVGVIDGIFPWAAWPAGVEDMTTDLDTQYRNNIANKTYMMAVSPWFYTNIAAWGKNWLWHSDSLWHDRWQEAVDFQPDIVEIISWNDYGESHYIGPVHDSGIPAGADYVSGMSHDGWRTVLPHYIQAYKSGNSTVKTDTDNEDAEKISYWYKLTPSTAGSTDGTTGNTASQGQTLYSPLTLSSDSIFFTVLVSQPSDVNVQVGSNGVSTFRATTSGINHFSTAMNGQTGNVTFTVVRDGQQIVTTTGPAITDSAPNGVVNFNAYSGSSDS